MLKKLLTVTMSLILVLSSTTQSFASNNFDFTRITVFDKKYQVVFTDEGKEENFPQEKIVDFLEQTPSRGEESVPFSWDNFTFQWNGRNFYALQKYTGAMFRNKPSPNFIVDSQVEEYVKNFVSRVVFVEVPNAPNVVQQWTAAVLLKRANEKDIPLEEAYYAEGQYDSRTFSVEAEVDSKLVNNVSKVLDQYLSGGIQVPSSLECQSKYFWGTLLLAWYHPESDDAPEEFQYFSTGDPISQETLEGYIE